MYKGYKDYYKTGERLDSQQILGFSAYSLEPLALRVNPLRLTCI